MGQYHIAVNLDKREFLHPHKMGDGLKLVEQAMSGPGGIATGLLVLLPCSSGKGGGDWIDGRHMIPVFNADGAYTHAEMKSDPYLTKLADGVVGRWSGDRIAIVGDYTEDDDLPNVPNASAIYALCHSKEELQEHVNYLREGGNHELANLLDNEGPYTDISDEVCAYLTAVEGIRYSGTGWRGRHVP